MTLTTDFTWHDLPLETPFGIARGTTEQSGNAIVRIEDDAGRVGIGGAAPSEYYGETRDSVEGIIPDLLSVVEDVGDPHHRQRIERRLRERAGGPAQQPAARSAVSVALYDLVCKQLDMPLYRYWGLDPEQPRISSFTIGLGETDEMAERAAEAVDAGYPVLKVKLGTERDKGIIAAIREVAPEATIRVDANEGWAPEEAIAMTAVLADHDIEFVEQPVPAGDTDGLRRVYTEGVLPIAADESCVTGRDIPSLADSTDSVVIKLSKCGGLGEARRMIATAHAHDLDVMLGCMTESNASIAAAAHLTPLVEYVDLDGALLLAEDAFEGIPMPGGKIDLRACERPGTGVSER